MRRHRLLRHTGKVACMRKLVNVAQAEDSCQF